LKSTIRVEALIDAVVHVGKRHQILSEHDAPTIKPGVSTPDTLIAAPAAIASDGSLLRFLGVFAHALWFVMRHRIRYHMWEVPKHISQLGLMDKSTGVESGSTHYAPSVCTKTVPSGTRC
jgi:hypothetical protein